MRETYQRTSIMRGYRCIFNGSAGCAWSTFSLKMVQVEWANKQGMFLNFWWGFQKWSAWNSREIALNTVNTANAAWNCVKFREIYFRENFGRYEPPKVICVKFAWNCVKYCEYGKRGVKLREIPLNYFYEKICRPYSKSQKVMVCELLAGSCHLCTYGHSGFWFKDLLGVIHRFWMMGPRKAVSC